MEWKLPVRVSPCSLLSWQRFLLTEPVILPKLIYMKSFEALRSGVCRRGNSEFAEFFLASLFSIPGNEAVSDASCMSTCDKICSLVARMI